MSIDVSQFHSIFFEESFEGLDIMESGLLSMSQGEIDDDTVNGIFRAAHSIKGGAGTFGFSNISEFTHGLETLLDQIRNGEREATDDVIETLLSAVDTLREMLTAVQDSSEVDTEKVKQVSKALEQILLGSTSDDVDKVMDEVSDADVSASEPLTHGLRNVFVHNLLWLMIIKN